METKIEKVAEKIANELEIEKTQELVKDITTALSALVLLRGEEVLERRDARKEKIIDGSRLLGGIDDVVDYLSYLRKDGYHKIYETWDGDRGTIFKAIKIGKETDEEYYSRLIGVIRPYLKKYWKEEEEKSLWELMQEINEWANGLNLKSVNR